MPSGSAGPMLRLTVRSLEGRAMEIALPVDETRTYTWLPLDLAAQLGLRRSGTCTMTNVRGRVVTRALAEVTLAADGVSRPVTVVLCEPGDPPAWGVTSLELLGLSVDAGGEVRRSDDLLGLEA